MAQITEELRENAITLKIFFEKKRLKMDRG